MKYLVTLFKTIRAFGLVRGGGIVAARATAMAVPASKWRSRSWQLPGFAHPVCLRLGTSDWGVLQQVFVGEEYDCPSPAHEQALDRFYQATLARSETPVIVDCGANIGLASIWYARKFPRARIIAVEPQPDNFRMLLTNIRDYPTISAVQGGISDRRASVTLANTGDAPWAWETVESDSGDIPTYTIDGLLAEVPGARLMIVKIDIEGSEVALFRSNLCWVDKAPVIVFEAHDWLLPWRGTFHAVAAALTNAPRDYLQRGENTFAFSHALLRTPIEQRERAPATVP